MKKNVIRSLEKIYLGHLFFSKIVDRIIIGRNNQVEYPFLSLLKTE